MSDRVFTWQMKKRIPSKRKANAVAEAEQISCIIYETRSQYPLFVYSEIRRRASCVHLFSSLLRINLALYAVIDGSLSRRYRNIGSEENIIFERIFKASPRRRGKAHRHRSERNSLAWNELLPRNRIYYCSEARI